MNNTNYLVVIENKKIYTYLLDDKQQWEVGRPSKNNIPDIKLSSLTISRKHGCFKNDSGYWFYIDGNGKNGTVHNKKHIQCTLKGRIRPVILRDGDVLVFGGGEEETINSSTVWSLFLCREYYTGWQIIDTEGLTDFNFSDSSKEFIYHNPEKGMTITTEDGVVIYMGEKTYLAGNIKMSAH